MFSGTQERRPLNGRYMLQPLGSHPNWANDLCCTRPKVHEKGRNEDGKAGKWGWISTNSSNCANLRKSLPANKYEIGKDKSAIAFGFM